MPAISVSLRLVVPAAGAETIVCRMRPRKAPGTILRASSSCFRYTNECAHACANEVLMQVIIPEEEPFLYEYQSLKDHLFRRYKQQVPADFTKAGPSVSQTFMFSKQLRGRQSALQCSGMELLNYLLNPCTMHGSL